MKIKSIRTVQLNLPETAPLATPSTVQYKTARRPSWVEDGPVANPMTRYPRYAAYRPSWRPLWHDFGCVVEAEDGTWGFAPANHGRAVASVIDDFLGVRLAGENCLATEKCYDMMVRMGAPHGATGLHAYAVSAIDLALWDLKGKILQRPVYELLGGPAHDELFCYSTGGDTDWYMELGFQATKLPCPYGPADGRDGLEKNVELIASTREMVGPKVELMLDCWMAFDVEYAVRLAEELRPYKLKWMEEMLRSEDFDAHAALRQRVLFVAGGPGTGKTYTAARLLALVLADRPTARVALAAPTGKAASRLTDSIGSALPGLPTDLAEAVPVEAVTLHKLLGAHPERAGFRHDARSPLPHDLVLVDEGSMVDLRLFDALLAALRPDAALVVLGDPDINPYMEGNLPY